MISCSRLRFGKLWILSGKATEHCSVPLEHCSVTSRAALYVEISCVFSKWFSATVTGHRCDHVSFLPSGERKMKQTLDNQYFNYILLFSLSFCIQIVWPFGFDILIKIFAVLWQIVKQIIFLLTFCIFGFHPPLVAEGNMVTPVTCDRFGAERTHGHTCDLWPFFWGREGSFRIFVNNWKQQRILQDAESMSSCLWKHCFKTPSA